MQDSIRPSKQFIIRGSVAIGIVLVVLVSQTKWFQSLFQKKEQTVVASKEQTVGDVIVKDTNENGIADWEETLWGLDPTVLYTNGVPNKTIIENKKKSLGVSDATIQPENETDELARDLLVITAGLGQSGEVTDENIREIAGRLADSATFKQISNHYSIKDIQAIQTTKTSLEQYYDSMNVLTKKYDVAMADINTVIESLETGNPNRLEELPDTQKRYEQFARELVALKTPVGVEDIHLRIANTVHGLGVSLGYLSELPTNGANALAGIALYKIYDTELTESLLDMENYLIRYGILNSQ